MEKPGTHKDDKISKADLPIPFNDRNYGEIPPPVYGFPHNRSTGIYSGTQPYYWDLGPLNPDGYNNLIQWREMDSSRYQPFTQVAIQENGMRLIRFLNAVDSSDAYNFNVDGRDAASGVVYGGFTDYITVPSGIHKISAALAQSPPAAPGTSLNIPFESEEKSTLILVRTGEGLEILKVDEDGCNHLTNSTGCMKAANMSFGTKAYDIIRNDGETVFGDLRFMDVTPFKQAEAGGYDLYVVESVPNKAAVSKPVLEREEDYSQVQREGLEQENYFAKFHVHVDSYGIYSIYILGTGDAIRVIVL